MFQFEKYIRILLLTVNKFQLVVPPGRSGRNNEYPMFVFCDGYKRDSEPPPIRPLPPDVEYSVEGQDSEYIETEEFEIL